MREKMTIGIISGASRSGRLSIKVAKYLEQLFSKQYDVEKVHFLDIHEYNFPNYVDSNERDQALNERLKDFSDKLISSHALVLVSPEYNGGMAGSTKNALDYFRKEYEKKVFGLVSVSSGTMGGINAMHQMVDFVSYVGGILNSKRLLVSEVQGAFDEDGNIKSERLENNAQYFMIELLFLARNMNKS